MAIIASSSSTSQEMTRLEGVVQTLHDVVGVVQALQDVVGSLKKEAKALRNEQTYMGMLVYALNKDFETNGQLK